MAKHESAWKQMFNFYRDEYHEQRAPMIYGDVWLKTKSRQRLILGLTTATTTPLSTVSALTLPQIGQHVAAGDVLTTVSDASGKHLITTPFGGTVLKINADLFSQPTKLATNQQKENWLVWLRAD